MTIKRIIAGAVSAATILGGLALGSATAQAEETTTDAATETITISGDVNGRTFTAYLLGTYTHPVVDEQTDTVTSVDFDQNDEGWDPSIQYAAEEAAKTDGTTIPAEYSNNPLAWIASLDQAKDAAALRTFAETLAKGSGKPDVAASATGATGTVALDNLQAGYYLVLDTNTDTGATTGTPIMVGTAIQANGKNYTTLGESTLGTAVAKPTQSTQPTKTVSGASEGSTSVGDELKYTVTGIIPGNPSGEELTMNFKDEAAKGLTMPRPEDGGFKVMIEDEDYTANTKIEQTINDTEKTTTTTFDLGDLRNYAGKTVTITYTATVNSDAVDEVHNTAVISDPDGVWATDGTTTTTKVYDFSFTKTDADGNALAGAQFTITGKNIDAAYAKSGMQTVATSDENGQVSFSGLAAGDYTVEETKVPDGYLQSVKPSFKVHVDADGVTFTQDAWKLLDTQKATLKNVKSVTQLPLTGAAGITMLIAVAVLLGGAAALIALRTRSLKRQLRS